MDNEEEINEQYDNILSMVDLLDPISPQLASIIKEQVNTRKKSPFQIQRGLLRRMILNIERGTISL